jgi:hypothetical protein
MNRSQKKEYLPRYLNWEVIASYLIHLKKFQEVFRCFKFPSKVLSPKIVAQFRVFLNDIKLPKHLRKFCGRHCGGEPGLGRVLDQMVFVKIYADFIEHNETDLHKNGCLDGCIFISNEIINKMVRLIIDQNEGTCVINTFQMKEKEIGRDYKLFQYSKTACNRFTHRWSIPNRYVISSERGDHPTSPPKSFLPLTNYAVEKGYPVDGWQIPTSTLSMANIVSSYSSTFIQITEYDRNPSKFEEAKNTTIVCSSFETDESNNICFNFQKNERNPKKLIIISEGPYIRSNMCLLSST